MMTSRTRPVTRDAKVNRETVEAVRSKFMVLLDGARGRGLEGADYRKRLLLAMTAFAPPGSGLLYSRTSLYLNTATAWPPPPKPRRRRFASPRAASACART